jgi:betaine-homocysteine S-methyltransferase
MSVAIGKKPISMKYMPDMRKHFHHGTDETLKQVNKEFTP